MGHTPRSWLARLSALQCRRAPIFVAIGFALALACLPLLLRLGLRSEWIALLPEHEPSVQDLERVKRRVRGLETLTIVLESHDLDAKERFARDLVPRLEALPRRLVQSVDWNVNEYADFVRAHRYLYADIDLLRRALDELEARKRWETIHANPLYVSLEDDEPPDPTALIDELRAEEARRAPPPDRYPDGFFVSPDHELLTIYIRTDVKGGEVARADELTDAVHAAIRSLGGPTRYAPDMRVELAGSVLIAREEHLGVARELRMATAVTVGCVLLSILVFFGRLRSVFLLGAALLVPVVITFGLAYPMVGFLNTATAFLGSIIIGNGINPLIMWLARYFEERRRGESVERAVAITHENVWTATLPASLAAAVAYGSLIVTDFRGFHDFGAIGFTGMVVCWLASLLFLPPLTVLSERLWPLSLRHREERPSYVGRAAAGLVHHSPWGVIVVSVVLTAVTLSAAAYAVAHDPWEYDFEHLKSVRPLSSRAQALHGRLKGVVNQSTEGTFIAAVVDDPAQAQWLDRRLTHLAEEGAPWGPVRSIFDLLPQDQEAKIPLLRKLRPLLLEVRPHLDEAHRRELDSVLPPPDPRPLTIDDLPPAAARPFTELDGRRGTLVLVERMRGRSAWDGRYLEEWTNALRQVHLPDGTRPPLAGRSTVFADMLHAVLGDAPIAVGVSFAGTVVLVLLAFRRTREQLLTLLSLVLGIVWMAGSMALAGMRLNFLNFVAFPITFGNGVDYGVNVMRRYVNERASRSHDPVRAAIRESGGAVMLASLTTIIGYLSLFVSANQALRSFGAAMAISETTCLAAALLTLPACLELLGRRREARSNVPERERPETDATPT